MKVGDCLFVVQKKLEESLKMARTLVNSATNEEKKADPDNLTQLVKETIPDFSCLIFCATKKNCESVATLLCKFLPRLEFLNLNFLGRFACVLFFH